MPKPSPHYQTLELNRVNTLIKAYAEEKNYALKILDFGCGHGKFSLLFQSQGCKVTAVDVNPAYVASMRSQGLNSQTTEDFLNQSSEKFDLIFLSHVIEHLSPKKLVKLIPELCRHLKEDGRLVLISPTPGERFYHDFSHIRPYLPQSIRHAFGQTGAPISYGEGKMIKMIDIYFFKDPFRTRFWRSFYTGNPINRGFTKQINTFFDLLWKISKGRIGVHASWLGVYQLHQA
jgi:SAM-dependent methyltransferase